MRHVTAGRICAVVAVAVFCLSLFPAGGSGANPGGITLVEGGRARATIVVPTDASPTARFAAREIQEYIRRSTGISLPIETSSDDGRAEIILGISSLTGRAGLNANGLVRDGFKIQTKGNRIYIFGVDSPDYDVGRRPDVVNSAWEMATLFGAYEFLERFVGVRWYLPIDVIGEVVPKRDAIVIPPTDLVSNPDKVYRDTQAGLGCDETDGPLPPEGSHLFIPAYAGAEQKAFMARRSLHFMRLRHSTMPPPGSHTMHRIIPVETYLPEHPEYFALSKEGGRIVPPEHRVAHNCFSDPGMRREFTRLAKSYSRGDPPPEAHRAKSWGGVGLETRIGRVFHFAQNDGFKACLCPRCEALRPTFRARGWDVEKGIIWRFLTEAASDIAREYPRALLSISAYGPLNSPPEYPIPKNIVLLKMAVEGPYSEFIPGMMRREEDVVGSWRKAIDIRALSFFNYANSAGYSNAYRSHRSICGSIPRAYASYYKKYGDLGCGTRIYINSHSLAYDHLNYYVYFKSHWDTDLDIDALLKEYYSLFYGPAADPMGRFWEEIEAAFRRALSNVIDHPLGPIGVMQEDPVLWGEIYNDAALARWQSYFDNAAKAASGNADPLYAKRIQYMKKNVLDVIAEGVIENRDLVAAARGGRNVVPVAMKNAGFEEAWDPEQVTGQPWTLRRQEAPTVKIRQDTSAKIEGRASGLIEGKCGWAGFGQSVGLQCGEVYRVRVSYIARQMEGGLRFNLIIRGNMRDGTKVMTKRKTLPYSEQWRSGEMIFKMPVPADKRPGDKLEAFIAIQAVDQGEGERAWVDDVRLEHLAQ